MFLNQKTRIKVQPAIFFGALVTRTVSLRLLFLLIHNFAKPLFGLDLMAFWPEFVLTAPLQDSNLAAFSARPSQA